MSTHKSFASLTGSMLARKTVLRPTLEMLPAGSNDLAGHDPAALDSPDEGSAASASTGQDSAGHEQADFAAVFGDTALAIALPVEPAAELLLAVKPVVSPVVAKVVPLVRPAAPTAPAIGLKPLPLRRTRTAAFTLRLDPDRHLRLRLACGLRGRSAQSLVTEAVDQLLADIPEIELLAHRISTESIVRPHWDRKP